MPLAKQIELPKRYRVARHIASGGMASVWEATDARLGRIVAVKVLGAQFALDESARARFQREARTAAQISGRPHIVTIYDIGEHREHAFIVMEYFAGGTVADRLRAARGSGAGIPRDTALRWLREAAAGLDMAHGAGIVHRDVKPANLMLDDHDRLAVGDFGIARLADDTPMTQTGQVLGTAAYLAPEQALGRPATAASDRYALAVVAYELLTGTRPFAGGPPAAQLRQHVEAPPPRASDAAPELPAAVDPVLARGLAKDPAERPASAGAFVFELERALRGGDARASALVRRRQANPPRRDTPTADTPPRGGNPPGSGSLSRRGSLPLALGVAGILMIGAIVALATGGDDPSPSQRGERAGTATTSRGGGAQKASAQPQGTPARTAPAPPPAAAGSEGPATDGDGPTAGGENPAALDARGYSLIKQGRYAEAVSLERRAVEGFRARGDRSGANYAYALYNLGTALHRSERPTEAIPFLEERLKISNDRRGIVEQELADARAASGDGDGEQ